MVKYILKVIKILLIIVCSVFSLNLSFDLISEPNTMLNIIGVLILGVLIGVAMYFINKRNINY
jgi:carbon starvation protein CstA